MSSLASRPFPKAATAASVLRKTDYFSTISVWPSSTELDTRGWLENFGSDERDLAAMLLNSFLYFSDAITKAMLDSVFHRLSIYALSASNEESPQLIWDKFKRDIVVTHVEGETPNLTDSGRIFMRLARQQLGISQSQIVSPEIALRILASGNGRPVIFLDDFLGSGDQMIATLARPHPIASGIEFSFEQIISDTKTPVFFTPLIACGDGVSTIGQFCPNLTILCAHELDERESPIHPDSIAWPAAFRDQGIRFIEQASVTAGIAHDKWRGHKELGAAICFSHCVPDATLPIFHHESSSWRPLVRRR